MEQIFLYKHNPDPKTRYVRWIGSWGALFTENVARSVEEPVDLAGASRTPKVKSKRCANEKAAGAQVREWAKQKVAEGYVASNKPTGSKPPPARESKPWPAGKAKPPRWLSRVAAPELARVRNAITTAKLQHRAADIESLLRPTIRFTLVPTKKSTRVESRFGGDPDLPEGFAWPHQGTTPLAFVAQYRLDETAHMDVENRLPRSGILSVFVYLVPDGDDYCERASVFLFKRERELRRTRPPHSASADGRPGKQALARPHLQLAVPSTDDRELASLRLTDDEAERYHDKVWLAVRDAPSSPSKPGAHLLLGYDRSLLVQIDSDRRFDLELGDVETLGISLDPKHLAARNFKRVRASL